MAPTCQFCGSVQEEIKNGTMASTHLSVWERAAPSSHSDARHFSSSPYATGAFQAATMVVLELRGNTSE